MDDFRVNRELAAPRSSYTEVHMRRVLITILVLVGILGVLAAVTFRGRHVKRKTDVAAVEKDIHDHVLIGSSRADVAAYLDQRKIVHSYIGELKGAA